MRVILFDKTEMIVSDEEAKQIVAAIQRDVKMISIHGNYFKPSAILAIKKGGDPVVVKHKIPERTELTEEQREAALRKYEEIKREFFRKRK